MFDAGYGHDSGMMPRRKEGSIVASMRMGVSHNAFVIQVSGPGERSALVVTFSRRRTIDVSDVEPG